MLPKTHFCIDLIFNPFDITSILAPSSTSNSNINLNFNHLDDQIETIIMKLLDGSNLYGYGGISISYNDGNYQIIRPLLCVNKKEIYDFK